MRIIMHSAPASLISFICPTRSFFFTQNFIIFFLLISLIFHRLRVLRIIYLPPHIPFITLSLSTSLFLLPRFFAFCGRMAWIEESHRLIKSCLSTRQNLITPGISPLIFFSHLFHSCASLFLPVQGLKRRVNSENSDGTDSEFCDTSS